MQLCQWITLTKDVNQESPENVTNISIKAKVKETRLENVQEIDTRRKKI